MNADYVFIDTIDKCLEAYQILKTQKTITVGIEGIDLSRTGRICLITIGTIDNVCYIFDIYTMGESAFDNGLSKVLSNGLIKKIIYDIRTKADALYHQFNVSIKGDKSAFQGVVDCQITATEAYDAFGERVIGFDKAMTFSSIPQRERMRMKIGKKRGKARDLMMKDSCKALTERPLDQRIIDFLVTDSVMLFDIFESTMKITGIKVRELKAETYDRMTNMINDSFEDMYPDDNGESYGHDMTHVDWNRLRKNIKNEYEYRQWRRMVEF